MAFELEDYWQGSGYSQTPDRATQYQEDYRPFDESRALGRDFSTPDFQNAPWAGGQTQDLDYGEINPWEGGTAPYGGDQSIIGSGGAVGAGAGMGVGAYGAGAVLGGGSYAGLAALGPPGMVGAGLMYGLNKAGVFNKKKKRGSTNLSAPAYQGYQFEPEEGFPSYYETAQDIQGLGGFEEGATNFQFQQPEQQGYDYSYSGGVAQPGSGQLANPSQQNYVGQQEQEYGSFYNRDKGGIYDTFTV